jgi:hypothetical protein
MRLNIDRYLGVVEALMPAEAIEEHSAEQSSREVN